MNSLKKRQNATRRCKKRKCAKEIEDRDKAKVKFDLERVKECNQEDCDTYLKCTKVKVKPVNLVNPKTWIKEFERWQKEAKKQCGSSIACDKYYACTRKVAKRTGYKKAVDDLIKCSEGC
jgi:hypothetical protein